MALFLPLCAVYSRFSFSAAYVSGSRTTIGRVWSVTSRSRQDAPTATVILVSASTPQPLARRRRIYHGHSPCRARTPRHSHLFRLGMGGRQCPGCRIRLSHDDPLPPVTFQACHRQFHTLCLALTAASLPVSCNTCIELNISTDSTPRSKKIVRSRLDDSQLLFTPPSATSQSAKRPSFAPSTPSSSTRAALKTHCASPSCLSLSPTDN